MMKRKTNHDGEFASAINNTIFTRFPFMKDYDPTTNLTSQCSAVRACAFQFLTFRNICSTRYDKDIFRDGELFKDAFRDSNISDKRTSAKHLNKALQVMRKGFTPPELAYFENLVQDFDHSLSNKTRYICTIDYGEATQVANQAMVLTKGRPHY